MISSFDMLSTAIKTLKAADGEPSETTMSFDAVAVAPPSSVAVKVIVKVPASAKLTFGLSSVED